MATPQTASGVGNDDLPDPLIPTQGDVVPAPDADLDDDPDLIAVEDDEEEDAGDADELDDDEEDDEDDEDEDDDGEIIAPEA